jgi:hypothetical protein
MGMSDEEAAWLVKNPGYGIEGVMTKTQTFEPGQPVLLLRLRVHDRVPGGGSEPPQDRSRGVMLWIAPAR